MAKSVGELVAAFADATVPKVNVIIGKAYGTAYVAMNSKSIGADLVYAWDNAEIGMMDASLAAKIMYADADAAELNEKAAQSNHGTAVYRRQYKYGIIVQTVGELEDVFDGEGMMETEARHKEYFVEFEKKLREIYPDMLAIGAGCCTKCKVCTYPDAPCRFPKQAFSSMEAYGMLVTQVCQANELQYYYGDCTIAYTSCYLLE